VNQLVCSLIAPDEPGLSFLEPLQEALAGSGTPFNCSSELATFDAAQGGTTLGAGAPSSDPTAAAQAALQAIDNDVYSLLGQPSNPKKGSLNDYLNSLLGGGGG